MSVPMKQRKASSGVQTIGSPRTLKLVFTRTGQPVRSLKALKQRVVARVRLACAPSGRARSSRRASPPGSSSAARSACRCRTAPAPPSVMTRRLSVDDVGDERHVGAVVVELEPFRHVLAQHRGRERAEALAVLDLRFRAFCIVGDARVAEDGARRRARAARTPCGPGTSRSPCPPRARRPCATNQRRRRRAPRTRAARRQAASRSPAG